MPSLKEKLYDKIVQGRERVIKLVKEHGSVKISDVTVGQAIGGARGVKSLVTDISYLDPEEGIRFRGHTIPETLERLEDNPWYNSYKNMAREKSLLIPIVPQRVW